MAVYPPYLSAEEKALKKRYAKLQEKRKLLRKTLEKASSSSGAKAKQLQRDLVSPKDAKEAAKKLLESGKLTITKKPPVKRSGFKRVGELPGQCPPAKRPNTTGGSSSVEKSPSKPKIRAADVKELYNRFVKPTNPEDLERIPKRQEAPETSQPSQSDTEKVFSTKERTVFVHCAGVMEEALRIAFSRFGEIQTLTPPDPSTCVSYITFKTPSIAETVRKEMDKGMIRGSEVHVEAASEENGFVELPPEAAKHPWAQIAAGRTVTESPLKRPEAQRSRHKEVISYEADF